MSDALASRTRQVVQLLFGTVAIQGSAIAVFILLARWLPVSEFGLYRQLFLIHQIVVGIFFSAVPTSLLYFCGKSDVGERGNFVHVHLKFVFASVLCSLFVLICFRSSIALALSNERLSGFIWLFAPYTASYMLYSLVGPALVAFGKSALASIFSIFLGLLNSIPVLIVAGLGGGLSSIVITASISAAVGAVLALLILMQITKDRPRKQTGGVSMRSVANYLWPLLAAGGVSLVSLRMDQLIVANLLGPELFGVYAVGAFEIPIFGLLQASVTTVLLPQFSILVREQKWSEMREVWKKALIKSASVVYPFAAILFVLSDATIDFLFGEKFKEAVPIFQTYLLLGPVRVMTFGLVLRAIGDTKSDLAGSVIYLGAVVMGAIFGVTFIGAVGATIAVVLATVGLVFFLMWRTKIVSGGNFSIAAMYPLKVLICFPALVLIYQIFLNNFLFEFFKIPTFEKLVVGGIVSALTIAGGMRFSHKLY